MSNPWRIDDSDDEDQAKNNRYDRLNSSLKISNRHDQINSSLQVNNQYDRVNSASRVSVRRTSLPAKPPTPTPTPKVLSIYNGPKVPEWNPLIPEERLKRKLGRKKTVPSYENAPSHHKPIFSGPPNLKLSGSTLFSTSCNSLFEENRLNKKIVAYTPETPPASPSATNTKFDPIKFIQEDLTKFIYTYIPKDHPFIRCFVRRDKTGLHNGFFPTYYLHTERPSDGRKIFLLAARRVGKLNRQTEYLITTNVETLTEKSGGDGFVGRLRGNNLAGTAYTLYDNGKSPNKYKYKPQHSKHGLRRELAAIIFNTNFLGFKGPRQINALIPKLENNIQPAQKEDTILDRWRDAQFADVLQLKNRLPHHAEETKAHMLEFDGDAQVQPSIKNFQMVIENENHEEELVMQFGRVDDDLFICDYRYPFSAIQAFSMALCSFDSRLVRE